MLPLTRSERNRKLAAASQGLKTERKSVTRSNPRNSENCPQPACLSPPAANNTHHAHGRDTLQVPSVAHGYPLCSKDAPSPSATITGMCSQAGMSRTALNPVHRGAADNRACASREILAWLLHSLAVTATGVCPKRDRPHRIVWRTGPSRFGRLTQAADSAESERAAQTPAARVCDSQRLRQSGRVGMNSSVCHRTLLRLTEPRS